MKRIGILLIVALGAIAGAQQLLRVSGGVEETAAVPEGLPPPVADAYVAQLRASGYYPVEEINAPTNTWCTRSVRTLALTNGAWRVEWVECPVPVRLDPVKLVGALLSLPDGTNKLTVAMSVPAVAEWFVGTPVYVRGSVLASAMQLLLGVDEATLEALARPCAEGRME